jgi:hypothetical protein
MAPWPARLLTILFMWMLFSSKAPHSDDSIG